VEGRPVEEITAAAARSGVTIISSAGPCPAASRPCAAGRAASSAGIVLLLARFLGGLHGLRRGHLLAPLAHIGLALADAPAAHAQILFRHLGAVLERVDGVLHRELVAVQVVGSLSRKAFSFSSSLRFSLATNSIDSSSRPLRRVSSITVSTASMICVNCVSVV
jgi:hypothetical protein